MVAQTPISLQHRHALGADTEARFFRAAELIHTNRIAKPPWLRRIQRATKEEDYNLGIDAVAVTNHGCIPIQIKSSRTWAERFEATHPDFSGIIQVIPPHEDLNCIAVDCIILLWQFYRRVERCEYQRA